MCVLNGVALAWSEDSAFGGVRGQLLNFAPSSMYRQRVWALDVGIDPHLQLSDDLGKKIELGFVDGALSDRTGLITWPHNFVFQRRTSMMQPTPSCPFLHMIATWRINAAHATVEDVPA